MTIVDLTELPHLGPLLAAWHAAEWGHLYDPAAWNEAVATKEFAAMAAPGSWDTTWVALAETTGGAAAATSGGDAPLGSISLFATDDLPGFEHVGPWLGSLYVIPRARRQGLGTALLEQATAEARRRGVAELFNFTADRAEWYEAQGWTVVAGTLANGHPVTVMRLDLAGPRI